MRMTTYRAVFFSLLLLCAAAPRADAQTETIWTVVIPEGFNGFVYTWRVHPDGTNLEDGRSASTGALIQQTLTGRWRLEGDRMTLTQDTLGFVFVGRKDKTRLTGVLTENGRRVSRFCAQEGAVTPRCYGEVGV